MDKNLIGSISMALIGISLLAFGLYFLVTTAKKFLVYEVGEGVVVEIRSRPSASSRGSSLSYPVVSFTARDGREYRTQGARAYSRSIPFSEGDTVKIHYNPANPREVMINTFFEIWGLGSLLSLFGAAFLEAGILAYLKTR